MNDNDKAKILIDKPVEEFTEEDHYFFDNFCSNKAGEAQKHLNFVKHEKRLTSLKGRCFKKVFGYEKDKTVRYDYVKVLDIFKNIRKHTFGTDYEYTTIIQQIHIYPNQGFADIGKSKSWVDYDTETPFGGKEIPESEYQEALDLAKKIILP